MDLDDYHENFYAGIHAANMAGTWQTIVFGFAGMRRVAGELEFSPNLPSAWDGYSFSIQYRGAVVKVSVSAGEVAFHLVNDVPVTIYLYNKPISLNNKGDAIHEKI